MKTVAENARSVALLGNEAEGDREEFKEAQRLLKKYGGHLPYVVIPWTFGIDKAVQTQIREQGGQFQVLVTFEKTIRFILGCEGFHSGPQAPGEWSEFVLPGYKDSTLSGRSMKLQLLVSDIKPFGGNGAALTDWYLWDRPGQPVQGALRNGWRYVYQPG